jgi:pentatricopeptide repeat protein
MLSRARGCADFRSWIEWRSNVALRLFDEMAPKGVEWTSLTFHRALSACVHWGMVDKAYTIFEQMKHLGIKPELKHYSCNA